MFTMYCIHIIHNLVHLVGYLYVKDVISARKMIHIKINLSFCIAYCIRKQNSMQISRKQRAVALQLPLAQHHSVKSINSDKLQVNAQELRSASASFTVCCVSITPGVHKCRVLGGQGD